MLQKISNLKKGETELRETHAISAAVALMVLSRSSRRDAWPLVAASARLTSLRRRASRFTTSFSAASLIAASSALADALSRDPQTTTATTLPTNSQLFHIEAPSLAPIDGTTSKQTARCVLKLANVNQIRA
jgi:hypothetical protein